MRYAIVSDLHANLQAWNAVLTDIGSNAVDRIICLGDVVGYGPNPAEVLGSAHRHVHAFVMGNHDAVVCGKMSADSFNPRARELISWTAGQLDKKAREFLAGQPLTLMGRGFRCTHGTFVNPAAFGYMLEPQDAAASWNIAPEPLLFVGHSHLPGLFVVGSSGVPHKLDAQDFSIEPGKRYIVNVGSVGAPRDGDARASYVLFDDSSGDVYFRRIPFDLDAFRNAVISVGFQPDDVPSLRSDPRRHLESVREALDFAPSGRTEHFAKDVVEVAEVERLLRKRTARWKLVAGAALVLAVVGSGMAYLYAGAGRNRPLTVPAAAQEAVDIRRMGTGDLLPALPDAVGADLGIRPWRVFYGDTRSQSVKVLYPDSRHPYNRLLLRSSDAKAPFRIEAPALLLDDGERKLTMSGEMERGEGFGGRLSLVMDLLREGESGESEWMPQYQTAEFRSLRGAPLERAQKTIDRGVPKYATAVRVALEGGFKGEVVLHSLSLVRRER